MLGVVCGEGRSDVVVEVSRQGYLLPCGVSKPPTVRH